jgi:hypothetical protein
VQLSPMELRTLNYTHYSIADFSAVNLVHNKGAGQTGKIDFLQTTALVRARARGRGTAECPKIWEIDQNLLLLVSCSEPVSRTIFTEGREKLKAASGILC